MLHRAAARRAWISVVSEDLSLRNCVALLALDFDTPGFELEVLVIF
jgi:hypothetical protein